METLSRVVASIKRACARAGVSVVTGDTKVVERGRGDGLYINTAGVGFLRWPGLTPKAIRPGDSVILSGTAGDHGTAVMLARPGDIILVAGKGHETYQIVGREKRHFDDREELAAAFREARI